MLNSPVNSNLVHPNTKIIQNIVFFSKFSMVLPIFRPHNQPKLETSFLLLWTLSKFAKRQGTQWSLYISSTIFTTPPLQHSCPQGEGFWFLLVVLKSNMFFGPPPYNASYPPSDNNPHPLTLHSHLSSAISSFSTILHFVWKFWHLNEFYVLCEIQTKNLFLCRWEW